MSEARLKVYVFTTWTAFPTAYVFPDPNRTIIFQL
jgi:hypothetical protein